MHCSVHIEKNIINVMFERSSLSVVKSSCLRLLTFPSTQLIIISSICIYVLLLYDPKFHNSYLLSTLSSLSVFSFFLVILFDILTFFYSLPLHCQSSLHPGLQGCFHNPHVIVIGLIIYP